MKPEKEFYWMIKLLNSRFVSGGLFFKGKSGWKNDFEREVCVSQKNKEFRKWINNLIDFGILEFSGKKCISKGKAVDTFVINPKKMESLLKQNEVYEVSKRFFDKRATIP